MASTLYVSGGNESVSAPSGIAIAGDNPTPYASAGLQTGMSLTTGDLSPGDPSDAGGLTDFAVEIWLKFPFGSAPTGAGDFLAGPQSTSGGLIQYGITIAAGGGWLFYAVNAAGSTVFSTPSAALQSSALVSSNSGWYHLMGVVTGGNILFYVNGVATGGGAGFTGTIRAASFAAGVSAMRIVWPGADPIFDKLAIYRSAISATRAAEHYRAGTSCGFRVQLSSDRITSILDAAASPAPRSIQAGVRSVIPRYTSGQAPLEEIHYSVEAEDVDACFFCAKDGTLTFLADGYRSSAPYNTSQVTFGDGGGAEIAYKDIQMDYSESFLINEWSVTRPPYNTATPVTQTVSDATSISRYFKRSQSLADVPTTTDAGCSTIATELLAKYKDPIQRVTEVTVQAQNPDASAAVLARELCDHVTVKRRPPGGGSAISQDVFVEQIQIDGSNDGAPWTFKLGVSPQ